MALIARAVSLLPALTLVVMAGCGGQAAAPQVTVEQRPADAVVAAANATLNAVLTRPAVTFGQAVNPAGPLETTAAEESATAVPEVLPATPTLAPTDTSQPSVTPTLAPSATPTATPSATPQPTATPTPDAGATQTAQAQQVAAAVAATLAVQATALAQEQALATAVAATLAARATAAPLPTPVPQPTAGPLLAYVYGDVGATDIQIYDPAGARTWTVADRACDEAEPDWTPDEHSVVYQSDCDGSYDLYLVNVETRAVRRLTATRDQDEREPDVSPDGLWVVYRANREQDARNVDGSLWVLDLGGGDPQSLGVSGRSPSWSPDGTQLLFMSERESGWEVYVYSPAERSTRRLTDCAPNCRFPAWSPDGQWVVYHATTGAETADAETIWRTPAGGGDAVLLVTGGGAGRPAWSSAGWVAFNSQQGIEIVDERGQQRRTLLAGNSHWAPVWSR